MDIRELVDPLNRALLDAGTSVFQDTRDIPLGGHIGTHVMAAIEGSRISIAFLSTDYASSISCLQELELMWECRKANGQTIIPIFYGVGPSDVKNLAGDFGAAFSRHETKGFINSEIIKKWKWVLQEIAQLKGHSANLYRGLDIRLLQNIVLDVLRRLRDDDGLHPKDGQAPGDDPAPPSDASSTAAPHPPGDDPASAVDAPTLDEEKIRELSVPTVEGQSFLVASDELVRRKSKAVSAGVRSLAQKVPEEPRASEEPKR